MSINLPPPVRIIKFKILISDNTPTNSKNAPVINCANDSENPNKIKNSAEMLDNISLSIPHQYYNFSKTCLKMLDNISPSIPHQYYNFSKT